MVVVGVAVAVGVGVVVIMRFFVLSLILYSHTIAAGYAEQIIAKHHYFMSGKVCSNQEDVNDYGNGDWVRCILHEREDLNVKWRSWRPAGLEIGE